MANDKQLSLHDIDLTDSSALTDKDRKELRKSMGLAGNKSPQKKKSM